MNAATLELAPLVAPIDVVIDTNVALDWLVFADPGALALGAALTAGRLRWIATEAMRAEWLEVLDRLLHQPPLQRWAAAHGPAGAAAERWMHTVTTPGPLPQPERLHSVDPDDQGFIDLALARRVPWLFSRDRALLRLARHAAPFGVQVLAPRDWPGLDTAIRTTTAGPTAARSPQA
jgi:predicted nucleic acid-binding protein